MYKFCDFIYMTVWKKQKLWKWKKKNNDSLGLGLGRRINTRGTREFVTLCSGCGSGGYVMVCLSKFINFTLRRVNFTLYQLYVDKPEKKKGKEKEENRRKKEGLGRKNKWRMNFMRESSEAKAFMILGFVFITLKSTQLFLSGVGAEGFLPWPACSPMLLHMVPSSIRAQEI